MFTSHLISLEESAFLTTLKNRKDVIFVPNNIIKDGH